MMALNKATSKGRQLRHDKKTLIKKGQENYEDTINACSGQLRKKQKGTEEQIVAFTQFPYILMQKSLKGG